MSNLPRYFIVFALLAAPSAAAGELTVLHQFARKPGDVSNPNSELIADKNGRFYGTTNNGVFRLAPPRRGKSRWTEIVIARGNYGSGLVWNKRGRVIFAVDEGDAADAGAIVRLSPLTPNKNKWRKTVLYRFRGGGDGEAPDGPLVVGRGGKLYGVTQYGDYSGNGTVFQLSPPSNGGKRWIKKFCIGSGVAAKALDLGAGCHLEKTARCMA